MTDHIHKYSGVPIRTIEYLNSKDAALPKAFLSTKENVPVYYQYCQPKTPTNDINPVDEIGTASNFRVNNDMIVCDVNVNVLHPLAHNFENMIDNYTVKLSQTKSTLEFTVTRLIIYNKEFKAKRDKEIIESIKTNIEGDTDDE